MDIAQLMQALPPDQALAAPPPDIGMAGTQPMLDPTMGMPAAPMTGMGMGAAGAFPSTDPAALAQVVQDALANLAEQDHHMLEMQQQQAAMQAQPIIDQMLMQATQPPMAPMGDPMMAFGEGGAGLPPLPPEEMVA